MTRRPVLSVGVVLSLLVVVFCVAAGTSKLAVAREDIANECPGFDRTGTYASAGLAGAAESVARRYSTGDVQSPYTGLRICIPTDSMVVMRAPGDGAFDERIRKIAQDHDVSLRFQDSKYTLAELRDASDVVSARLTQLAESGATWSYTLIDQAGSPHVEVGVSGDVDAARDVLADLGDRVTVVHGDAPVPL